MGRRDEFHAGRGGAYGDFSPEPVDIDLSDKVSDHPFYDQPSHLPFHDPNLPMSTKCMEPGCGRQVHEHQSQSMKPTQQGYEMMLRAVEEAKTSRRTEKETAARESFENDEAMKGHHGIGRHTIQGHGWSDRGPKNLDELKTHLVEDHDTDEDDVEMMEHHASSHARWHAEEDWDWGHDHHPPGQGKRKS